MVKESFVAESRAPGSVGLFEVRQSCFTFLPDNQYLEIRAFGPPCSCKDTTFITPQNVLYRYHTYGR